MPAEIHKGNIGTILRITILDSDGNPMTNLGSATTKQIIITKPNGTKLTKTASFYTDGSDGIIQYTVISGDLDSAGLWKIQAFCIIGVQEFYSDIETFRVYRNL